MRLLRPGAAAFVAVLCATVAADPPVAEFPARFANTERIVVVAVLSGNGESRRSVRRQRIEGHLVLDDASNLHLEEPGSTGPDYAANWEWTSHRALRFTLTQETMDEFRTQLGAALPFKVHVGFGRGRLVFSRGHGSYSGSQVIRCAGNYRGYRISVVETVRHSGSRETAAPAEAPADGGTLAALAAERFRASVAGLAPRLAR